MTKSSHTGKCHCKAVRFQAITPLDDPVRCNCSFCERRGTLLQKLPVGRFSLIAGEEVLRRYGQRSFSDHFFCGRCGVHTFTKSSRKGEDSIIVNIACLIDVDLDSLTPRVFDGATLL